MANVLLISANITEEPYPVYPLGMTIVAESVRRHGHDVSMLDLLYLGKSMDKLSLLVKEKKPDVIGLSLRNVDNVVHHAPESYADNYRGIVTVLRSLCSAPIILGGSAFTILPEEFLNIIGADYGISGPGEEEFPALIDLLSGGGHPREKIIRAGISEKELMGITTRDPHLAAYYLHTGGMLNIQTKRGCPHRCAYCSYPVIEGSSYRFREPSEVADEIEILAKNYNADYFSIVDSVFNDCEGNYLAIAEELVRREIKIPWMCFLRPTAFRKEEVDLLKRAGLASVEWGTDSSTDETLGEMGKDFSWDDVIRSTALFHEAGIANGHFVIFGGPGETENTLKQGLANIDRLQNCVIFIGAGVRIYPETPIYHRSLDEGVISKQTNLIAPAYYFSSSIDAKDLENELSQFCLGKLDRIYDMKEFGDKIAAFHVLGYRGPVWDFLLKKAGPRRRERN